VAKQAVFLRLAVVTVGFGLGTVLGIGLGRLAKAGSEGLLSAPEEAQCGPRGRSPQGGMFLAMGLLVVVAAVAVSLGGSPISPTLAILIALMALLPSDLVCLVRSKGLERKGRLGTVLLVVGWALTLVVGMPLNLGLRGIGAGLLLGLLVLLLPHVRVKGLAKG
jgi:hypothetical protein